MSRPTDSNVSRHRRSVYKITLENNTFSGSFLNVLLDFIFTYVAARHDKIDPMVRVRVNLDSECLGEECCSSEKDEKFWDVDEHLRHSAMICRNS